MSTIIILLDSYSKSLIKTDIAEIAMKGAMFVNNLAEIPDTVLKDSKRVVVFESYFKNRDSYSTIRLFKNLLNLEYIFIGTDTKLLEYLKEYGSVYKANVSTIDYATIQGAIFGDKSLETDNSSTYNMEIIELAKKIVSQPDEYDAQYCKLADNFLALSAELEHKIAQLNIMKNEVSILSNTNASLIAEGNMLSVGLTDMFVNAKSLNDSLKTYEMILSKPVYDKILVHKYNNKPNIVYVKVYEEFYNFEQYVETLVNVFKLQKHCTIKILRLYDNTGAKRIKVLPKYYKVLTNSFLMEDVMREQFIAKVGDYREIMNMLLTNKLGVDILLVIDCKDFEDIVVNDCTLLLNACTNAEHLKKFGLLKENTLVSFEDESEYLSWNSYKIDDLTEQESFLYLSARRAITQVINLFNLYTSTF